ncbi:zinc finger CCCH domain-containing protein 39 [Tripterygium wilfordii]|uniref:Zinc finger CCCH domain-containing protein 39 n=1 Tax=Tripterygium wilfordii TaxID=458696 RepID=A0A7J7DTG4_TRIWF|nr:zinc finger CCCH domain-containing protein 39-like [Tripterygium wilfordii]KAF5749655.1 zinc finger CCCH domain-containing protein 39 [Tripterygium wilfordii]
MSFPDPVPPFGPFSGASDAITIGVWPQIQNNEQFDTHSQFEQQSPFKRPRNSEDNPSMNSRMPPQSIPVNKGITNIFFKTRMCAKFRNGTCRNGENCNFAHGMDDLRRPPPNWQDLVGGRDEDRPPQPPPCNWEDDMKIIHKMKLCKKYYNGEECPYGDRCNFLHEEPSKFKEDSGRFRESSVISIGTTGQPVVQGGGFDHCDGNWSVNNSGPDAFQVNIKPVYWKTKLCIKWETTGTCSFGEKCHFAHGQAELQLSAGRIEVEAGNSSFISTKPQSILPVIDASVSKMVGVPAFTEEGQGKKCLFKWKGHKKINRIYADWLDDLPLVQSLPSRVGS